MKTRFYILLIFVIYASCQNQKELEQIETPKIIQNPLNGTWGMTQYFDTIIANKSIAKYRTQSPTWSALLIDIQNDTIITYGSIFDQCVTADFTKDTIATIMSWTEQDYWWFIKTDSSINLIILLYI